MVAFAKAQEPTFLRALFEDSQGLLEQEVTRLRATLRELVAGFNKRDLTQQRAMELRQRALNERDNVVRFRANLCDAIGRGAFEGVRGE